MTTAIAHWNSYKTLSNRVNLFFLRKVYNFLWQYLVTHLYVRRCVEVICREDRYLIVDVVNASIELSLRSPRAKLWRPNVQGYWAAPFKIRWIFIIRAFSLGVGDIYAMCGCAAKCCNLSIVLLLFEFCCCCIFF